MYKKYTKILISFVALALLITIPVFKVSAASPTHGCFQKTDNSNTYTDTGTICRAALENPDTNCYVQTIPSYDQGNTVPPYVPVDCSTITVSASTVPPPAINQTLDACSTAPATDPCHNIIVTKYLVPAIDFLSVGIAVIVTVMIAIGGIQYASAGGDPQKVAQAKKRITNALLALLAFLFLYGFLQFIVPGGVFK